uniref:Ycf29 n=1 Tax=Nemalion vermiculare TaxID=935621 RepID=UPI00257D7AC3|nr:Ycf29 [Nemalion vermiculare]WGV34373.1 Ycf29 [Nemalion vermiculare]
MCYRVLLVEDDINLLSTTSDYLSEQGLEIDSVISVKEAIEILHTETYDLIISDILMPDQDGYYLIEYIRNNDSTFNVPLIFLTAKGMTQDRILGYDLGCYGYLTKPFDPTELLSMILSIVHNTRKLMQHNQISYVKSTNSEVEASFKKQRTHLFNTLTSREKAVLRFVLQGMTNKEIAQALSLSVRNIEKYVSRLLSRTSTRNRTQLVQYFYKIGMLKEGE